MTSRAKLAPPKAARGRPQPRRRWPRLLATQLYAGALAKHKPSPYPHVWDEEPGAGSNGGELLRDVADLDPRDAEFWVAVLIAMPWPMQVHFFSLRATANRQAWFAVANADASRAPAFLEARSAYQSEKSRMVRQLLHRIPPALVEVSEND